VEFVVLDVDIDVEEGKGLRNDCRGSRVVSFCKRSSWRERKDCSGSEVVVIAFTSLVCLHQLASQIGTAS
jgi:hypothetical protein